jgi:hypothetical protein
MSLTTLQPLAEGVTLDEFGHLKFFGHVQRADYCKVSSKEYIKETL